MAADRILTNVRGLLPAIRARREEIEQARRMPADLIQAMRETRLFALGVPRDLGGEEAKLTEIVRAIESVATADGSAGWCAMIAISSNEVAGFMTSRGAREVFAQPTAPSAGIAAPAGAAVRVDGGFRVNGRWQFASGITHSDWVWAGCLVIEDGKPRMTPNGPETVHVCMPVSEVQVHDTWFVSGLRGTGSNDFSATNVFVPEERSFQLLNPAGHRQGPLYQLPALVVFVYHVAAVSLGIARSALDELAEFAQTKKPTLYTNVLADRPFAQIELARAEAALGGARSFLYETIQDLWQAGAASRAPTPRQIALGRIAATHAVETAAAVTRTANTLGGGSSIFVASSLQRHARDAEAVTHHFTVTPHTWEEAGRVLLGREPNVPVF